MKKTYFFALVVVLLIVACAPASAAVPSSSGSVHPAVQRLLNSSEAWWSSNCPQVAWRNGQYVAVKTLWSVSESGYGNPKLCYYYGSVVGVVRDSRTNQPIAGVMVTAVAYGSCPGDCRASWASAGAGGPYPEGFYALAPLFPAGWYRVTFSKYGYYSQTAWLYLGWGREYRRDVFLYPTR